MDKRNPKPRQKTKYSFLKILTGSDLSIRRLAMMEVSAPEPGPVVWLTGCVHGDEVGGMVVIQEIFKRLKKRPLKKGSLMAFPLMNPVGFETGSRSIGFSKEDLNRSFPGDKNGSMAERIADTIFSNVLKTGPALVIDLHNDWIKSIPYALIDPNPGARHKDNYEKVKTFAKSSGFLVISEKEDAANVEMLKKTLTGSLIQRDVPAFTMELGEAYIVNEKNVSDGVRSVWTILAHLEMAEPLAEPFNYQLPPALKNKVLKYSQRPESPSSGIVRFLLKPGDLVRAGQPVARIYNVFGKLLKTIAAETDGLALGHADYSVALPGLPLVAFGIMDKDIAAKVMPPPDKPASPEKPSPAPAKPAPEKPAPVKPAPEKPAPEKPAPAAVRKEPDDKKKPGSEKPATGEEHGKQDGPGRKT
ncbi:MAG TPA: succinylglutamate desuccinylase/aspartoacylase family protein [bacterium]|nr:succinylglutamate desuccinylase/aspartoacylase family protein [bacterium]